MVYVHLPNHKSNISTKGQEGIHELKVVQFQILFFIYKLWQIKLKHFKFGLVFMHEAYSFPFALVLCTLKMFVYDICPPSSRWFEEQNYAQKEVCRNTYTNFFYDLIFLLFQINRAILTEGYFFLTFLLFCITFIIDTPSFLIQSVQLLSVIEMS